MTQVLTERRRTSRVTPPDEPRISLTVSLSVQVLDISESGVMLGSKTELAVGDRASLRASLGTRSVSVAIEVRHVSIDAKARGGLRYRAGAVFVALSAEQRLLLGQMLAGERS